MKTHICAFILLVFPALIHINNVNAQQIAFASGRDDNYEIYTMNSDASNFRTQDIESIREMVLLQV